MSLRVEIQDLVHGMLLAALAVDGATAGKIIPSNDQGNGIRPAAPYLTTRVVAVSGIAEGDVARTTSVADVLHTGRQLREARIAIQAFGEVAVGWLESLPLRFGWPAVVAIAAARETSEPTDLSEFLDTGFVPRAEMEIGVYVSVTDGRSATLIPTATIGLDALNDTFILDVE